MENRPGASPPIDDSVDRVRSAAGDALSDMKHAAKDAVHAVKDRAKDTAEGVQAKAADQARTAAHTLRDTADNLNGELPWMKTALNKTADGFDHITTALNRGDVSQALNSVSDFARRQPALFLGLSVAAGFALARVGKTALEGLKPDETSQADRKDELLLDEAVAPYSPVAEI
ncbi:MAG: hypothetical protein Q8R02_22165 [Hyphomonadaceae bacterium]|nr:hypothetical protein [Hyphomonadaceae bacterium]